MSNKEAIKSLCGKAVPLREKRPGDIEVKLDYQQEEDDYDDDLELERLWSLAQEVEQAVRVSYPQAKAESVAGDTCIVISSNQKGLSPTAFYEAIQGTLKRILNNKQNLPKEVIKPFKFDFR